MRTPWIRLSTGAAGFLAMAWLAAAGITAAADADASTAKAIEADIAFLKKGLEKTPEKRAVPTLKAAAMNLALVGSGDLREQALKVAEAITKKDYTAAKTAADKLPAAAGTKGDAAKLAAAANYDLAEVMSAYRADKVGGMNIEKDIKTNGKKDAKVAELAAVRSLLIAEYTLALPTDKAAANDAGKKKWEAFTRDQIKAAAEVAAEAAKGDAADKAALTKKLAALDASCVACHNDFRD